MSLLQDTIFYWVQFIINFIQKYVWDITGINRSYEESACVCKIWTRHKTAADTEMSNKEDFIYVLEKFAHPNIILNDNISLYSVNEVEAVFVDCGVVDVFDSAHDAFVYNTQFRMAKKIIILPVESFHRMAKDIPLPNIPMINLANHGRCGSTLLCKLFEAMPNTLSIFETLPFSSLANVSRKGHIGYETISKLFSSTIMCTVKHANKRNSEILLLKCQSSAVYVIDIITDVVPHIKHIYMYRQPVPFVRSYEKIFAINGIKISVKALKLWCGLGHNRSLKCSPVYPSYFLKELNNFTKFSLLWITCVAVFNNLVTNGYHIKSLKYEDLLENPKSVLLAIFNYAGIPVTKIPNIEKVMYKDSQAGNKYSTRSIDKKILESSYTPITKNLKAEVDGICKDFKVPLFWDTLYLPEKLE